MSESVTAEIRKFISDKIAAGETVVVEWLTQEVVSAKAAIEGDDLPFYRVCAYAHVKDIVKRCVGKYDARPETNRQIVLPGFDHLQEAYTVRRNDEIVLVPISQLSDSELLDRAAEYDDMAKGCHKHALEIRGFVRAREYEAVA